MKAGRIVLLGMLVAAVVAFFAFDLGQYLTLESIKARSGALHAQVQANPVWAAGVFFVLYAALTALSFPGTVVLTLLAGALFGLVEGTLLLSFASNVGAVIAMLICRFMMRDWVQKRFGKQIAGINKGLARDGSFYLVSLRLIPLVPFVLLNPALGLTRVSLWTFWWTTQLGMLPGHAIYVNAGLQLVQLRELSGILSPSIIGTLVLLAVFPLVATRALTFYKARKVYRGWRKPKRFDCNLVVIGGGTGGLATARIAASLKARVCLVERERLGGLAVHEGSVPSRALGRLAQAAVTERDAAAAFPALMAAAQKLADAARPQVSVEHFTRLGVEVIAGEARLSSPWTVEVGGQTLTTRAIVIATGTRPRVPPIPGLAAAEPLTFDTLWQLRERPARLLVLGSGPGACEFAQIFQRLGCQVTLVAEDELLLREEDGEAAAAVTAALQAEGVELRLGTTVERIESADGAHRLLGRAGSQALSLPFDRVLLALGAHADIERLNLDPLGLYCNDDGTLEVDEYLATRFPNVYAVGSVAGPYGAPHVAEHQAWFAAVNALFGGLRRRPVSGRAIPRAVFTAPEVACVGLTAAQARALELEFETTHLDLATLPGAVVTGGGEGFVRVLTEPGKDRILGVTVVGAQASETITGFVLAMRHKLGLRKLGAAVQLSPSLAEAGRAVAELWQRRHRSPRLLRWAARYHRRRVGSDNR